MFRRRCKMLLLFDAGHGFSRPVAKYPLTQGATPWPATRTCKNCFTKPSRTFILKILSALPKMAKAAQSEELKAGFEKHETETEEHVARLGKVFRVVLYCLHSCCPSMFHGLIAICLVDNSNDDLIRFAQKVRTVSRMQKSGWLCPRSRRPTGNVATCSKCGYDLTQNSN
jgi:hypothetical protein